MTVTTAQILRLAPNARADLVAAIVDNWTVAKAAGIDTPRRIRHFLARIMTETGGLRAIEENLNYTTTLALRRAWPSRFKTDASAVPFIRNPEALANKVYGGRMGNDAPGDGWRYRGGGMLQTTGRQGYAALGLEDEPDRLRQPQPAFISAVKEWSKRGCNALADKDDVVAVCKAINGGTNGLGDQRTWLATAAKVWPDDAVGYPILAFGSPREADVVELQRQLKAAGLYAGKIDGDFGKGTKAAVVELQRRRGLTQDGIAGPKTRAALSDLL